ncbi:hypothetical protein WJU23_10850 [Prosthecobacter sp. SYSU 5D2]|uniref:hypothetical protein n=1 Tax=Prosthecobacter sp. SYSU 5D2 TaxID=3134134 RepID=UPI0031FF09AC
MKLPFLCRLDESGVLLNPGHIDADLSVNGAGRELGLPKPGLRVWLVGIFLALAGTVTANNFDDWVESNRGRVWTAADGRKIEAVLLSYDWPGKTVTVKRKDGNRFTFELQYLSQEDYQFIKELATVPRLITPADMKERLLSHQLRDIYGNVSTYGGKNQRLLDEFKNTVRAGQYEIEIQLEAIEWNAAEYRRVGDIENAEKADAKRSELTLQKEQRNLLRRQVEAAEATAEAAQDMARQLQQIKNEIWMYRNSW